MFEMMLGIIGGGDKRVIKGWKKLDSTDMKPARYMGMVSIGDDVYIYGGAGVGSRVGDLWKYNTVTEERTLMPAGPSGRSEPAMAAVGNNLYIIGGWPTPQGITNELHIFNTVTKQWSTGAVYPTVITNARAVAINEYIYVAGGTPTGSAAPTNLMCRYNTTTNTWAVIKELPEAMSAGVFFTLDNQYLYYAMGTASSNVHRYTISNNTWTTLSNGPGNYIHLSSTVVNGKAYMWGSTTAATSRLLFEFNGTTWKTMPQTEPYPSIQYGSGMTSVGFDLYMFGGVIGSTYQNGFWKYEM